MKHIAAIAFDLDGTLVDSAPDIQRALNHALRSTGHASFDLDTVRGWIGDGPDALIARALRAQGVPTPDPRLRALFDEATLDAPLGDGRVFDGIAELVEGLRRTHRMAVVTNKPTPLARAVLGAAGLLPYMQSVHGADSPKQRKPAPTLLLQAACALDEPTRHLLMVGDSIADLHCAQAAGCPAALVEWGYGTDIEHDAWRVRTPQHLLAALTNSTFRRSPCPLEAASHSPSS